MTPKIQYRKNTKGQYEAFHILVKSNGRKMKIYETADSMQGAGRKLRSLLSPMFRRETAYKLCKK